MRPSLSVSIAILYPLPTSPSTFSFGTRQSSRISSQVDEARIPSLSSFFADAKAEEVLLDQKCRDPLVSFRRIHGGKENEQSSLFAIRDPELASVKNEIIAFELGFGLQRETRSDPDPASLKAYAPTVSAAIFGR